MVHNQTTNCRNFAEQLFLGGIALASVTLAFFRLGVDLASIGKPQHIMAVATLLLTSSIEMRLIRSARERTEAALRALAYLRRGEAYLRDSEKQWREFFEHSPAMYFMIDATGTVASVNSVVSSLITLSGTSKEND